jgi:uncharacterized damage-inducible protein DinB
MASQTVDQIFRDAPSEILTETFERVAGYYLAVETSLFETLETISSEEASRPVSATCASIAGQVEHTRIYIWLVTELLCGRQAKNTDWQTTWSVTSVSNEEWDQLKSKLRDSYCELRQALESPETRSREDAVSDSTTVVHTAYNIGEIRQVLCTIRQWVGSNRCDEATGYRSGATQRSRPASLAAN